MTQISVAFILLPLTMEVLFVAQGRSAQQTSSGNSTMSYSVVENLQPGVVVANIAHDAKLSELFDATTSNSLQFEILKGPFKDYFTIESPAGLLKTKDVIDRDALCPKETVCVLGLDVAIIRPAQKFRIFRLEVMVTDVNDNSPRFEPGSATINVSESAHPGTIVVIPGATDLDSGTSDVQDYTFACNSSKFELVVVRNPDGSTDLQLRVKVKLDREAEDRYAGVVTALDGGSPSRTGTLDVAISVLDANDNVPVFDRASYNASVREDFPINGIILWIRAVDADDGANGEVTYSFARQTQSAFGSVFSIDPARGDISLKRALDFEMESSYNLLVVASDKGPDSIPAYAKVTIAVEDLNDNPPAVRTNAVDSDGFAEVAENEPPLSFVAHISAEDLDSGVNGQVSCELLRGHGFGLQQLYDMEFKLVTTTVFDREDTAEYSVTVVCHDHGNPSLSTSKDIVVKITDSNDNAPVFDRTEYRTSVREGNPEGIPLVRINASDSDAGINAVVEYVLCPEDSGRAFVSVDNSSGLLTAAVSLDYEKTKELRFCVIAADNGRHRLTSSAVVTVSVIDVNDEAPSFGQQSYTFGTYENQSPSSEIGTVSAVDPDQHPFDKFVFSLMKETPELDSFSIDPYTGRITTTKILDREQCGAHHLTVAATNVAFPNPSSTVVVTVYVADKNDNAPHVDYPTRDNNTVELSGFYSVGSTFTRIYASDADSGINAKLNFAIVKGNRENSFDIDPISGAVSVNRDLRGFVDSERSSFRLIIAVSDSGTPPKSSEVVLNVVLVSSHALGTPVLQSSSAGLELTGHRKILILVGGVTVILISVLVTSIVCIKWRQAVYKRKLRRYWPGKNYTPAVACAEESRYQNISDCYTAALKDNQDANNDTNPIYGNAQTLCQKNVHFDLSLDPVDGYEYSQSLANQISTSKASRTFFSIPNQQSFVQTPDLWVEN